MKPGAPSPASDILFVIRAGMSLRGAGVRVRMSWPLGRIGFTPDALLLKAGVRRYRINFTDLEHIRLGLVAVQIIHHAPAIPTGIAVWGARLPQRLQDAIAQFRVPVQTVRLRL